MATRIGIFAPDAPLLGFRKPSWPMTTILSGVLEGSFSVPVAPDSFFVLFVTVAASNTFRVYFATEPKHQSSLATDDALNRDLWTIEVLAGDGAIPVVTAVENAQPQPTIDLSWPDAWSVDIRTDRLLEWPTTYRVVPSLAIRNRDRTLAVVI
jgi:hypothetical protein